MSTAPSPIPSMIARSAISASGDVGGPITRSVVDVGGPTDGKCTQSMRA